MIVDRTRQTSRPMTTQAEPQEAIPGMIETVPSRLMTARALQEKRIPWMIVDCT